jgi:hypothetical protein
VAAIRQSGVSIAAQASSHVVNANVLRCWLKEYENSGRRQLIRFDPFGAPLSISPVSAFISLKLPIVIHECKVPELAVPPDVSEFNVELRKGAGALSMIVTWPLGVVDDFTQWTVLTLKWSAYGLTLCQQAGKPFEGSGARRDLRILLRLTTYIRKRDPTFSE